MNIKLSIKRSGSGIIALGLALMLTTFAACSKSSPIDALKAYYAAAKKKDVETVKSYLSRSTLQMMEEIAKAQGKTLDQMFKEGADRDSQMPEPEFSNEKINGDTATVDIKAPNKPLITMQMVKEDGKWKLAIDKMMGAAATKPAGEKPATEDHGGSSNESGNGNDNH